MAAVPLAHARRGVTRLGMASARGRDDDELFVRPAAARGIGAGAGRALEAADWVRGIGAHQARHAGRAHQVARGAHRERARLLAHTHGASNRISVHSFSTYYSPSLHMRPSHMYNIKHI